MATGNPVPQSKHFQLHELADGVYAAIAIEGTGSGSNAGIINLGDRTLIFDTFTTPQAADDLRRAAEHLTGRPVSLVINSHWHADHIQGNQAFAPETTIVATRRTRELMATSGAETLASYKQTAADTLQQLQAELQQAQDEQQRAALTVQLGEAAEMAACAPTLTLRLPDQTFDERLVIQGTRRTAELLTYGGGHTESDAFLLLPDDRLIFTGDLLFVKSHLWIGDGDPVTWRQIVARMKTLDTSVCVPGHGPIGTPADYDIETRYLEQVEQMVRNALQQGLSPEQAAAIPIPAAYADWAWQVGWSSSLHALVARGR